MGEPLEALSVLCNGQIRVCLSECCHGDDGLLRGYGTHSNVSPEYQISVKFSPKYLPYNALDTEYILKTIIANMNENLKLIFLLPILNFYVVDLVSSAVRPQGEYKAQQVVATRPWG